MSESTVIERGPFWRTWRTATREVDPVTAAVTERVGVYTELGAGMHYHDGEGWVESEPLIELSPAGGAEAVRGQHKAFLPPTLATPVRLTMPGGQLFALQPLGLYYFDAASGRAAQLAEVDPEVSGLLLPPNRILYLKAFGELGDAVYVYEVNRLDQGVLLAKAPPPPEAFGLPSASTRLEVWTAFDGPAPQEERQLLLKSEPTPWRRHGMAEPDLIDRMLIFEDCWFPVGAAFVPGDPGFPEREQAPRPAVPDPSDPTTVPMAKNLVQIDDRTVLVKSVGYPELSPKLMAGLGQGDGRANRGGLASQVSRRRTLPARSPGRRTDRRIEVATAPYNPSGLLLGCTILSGSSSSYTFSNGWTYVISNRFYLGPGTTTFQQNSTIKYATNAWLLMYGPVSFPASGAPVTFTSVDDNAYGQTIAGSTSMPNYAAKPAIHIYYPRFPTTVRNARVRWAQRGVQQDQNPGVRVGPAVSSSTFWNCGVGVRINIPDDILTLTSDTGCNLLAPVQIEAGACSGSIATDCGVALVSRVNHPTNDTASGDPNKNHQSECTFVVVDTNRIVAAFFDTHLSQWGLGERAAFFPGLPPPRSTGWAVSTDGGASFVDKGAIPPTRPADPTQGDAGDPVMARDTVNRTIYLLTNPARVGWRWPGFRLWISRDDGRSFALANTNVPGTITEADKPMLAVNNHPGLSTSTNLYLAGTAGGVFVSRSSNAGATWVGTTNFGVGHGADLAIRPDGTVYVFYLNSTPTNGAYANLLQYHWLPPGRSAWQGPGTIPAHPGMTHLRSLGRIGSGHPRRSNSATANDYFLSNGFPRVAVNPANGHVYVVYADLPFAGSSTDRGDIFIQRGIPESAGSLRWSGAVRVNNDRTATDQWNPSVAINPAGSKVFVGYYSRQDDPGDNALVRAYGAKADVSKGVLGATFDVFPVGCASFTNLFCGTTHSTPSTAPWLFDGVWAQTNVTMDASGRVVDPASANVAFTTDGTYMNFNADDYTWVAADSAYFYFAWRDCSDPCTNVWNGFHYARPDADVRLGKVKQ